MEIAKRLNAIIAQLLPFLSQEVTVFQILTHAFLSLDFLPGRVKTHFQDNCGEFEIQLLLLLWQSLLVSLSSAAETLCAERYIIFVF